MSNETSKKIIMFLIHAPIVLLFAAFITIFAASIPKDKVCEKQYWTGAYWNFYGFRQKCLVRTEVVKTEEFIYPSK